MAAGPVPGVGFNPQSKVLHPESISDKPLPRYQPLQERGFPTTKLALSLKQSSTGSCQLAVHGDALCCVGHLFSKILASQLDLEFTSHMLTP